jgi:hypothetical protein
MFAGWHDFHLVLGPASAGLIGLLFVVMSLTAGIERSRGLRGAQIYMTPIVFHLGTLVLLSTLALVPRMAALPMGAAAALCGLLGLAYAAYVCRAMLSKSVQSYPGDLWCYGLAVGLLYLGMIVAGVVILAGHAAGPYLLALDQIVLFLLMVNNAWDLVVFITPRKDDSRPPPPAPESA